MEPKALDVTTSTKQDTFAKIWALVKSNPNNLNTY